MYIHTYIPDVKEKVKLSIYKQKKIHVSDSSSSY